MDIALQCTSGMLPVFGIDIFFLPSRFDSPLAEDDAVDVAGDDPPRDEAGVAAAYTT